MQSIPKKKFKNILIIINIILFIILIASIISINNTLSLKSIGNEIHKTFGSDYIVTTFDINNNSFVVSASIPENKYIETDYADSIDQFKNKINQYKPNKSIDRIVLEVGYHTEDTKYIKSTTDINLIR